MPLLPGQRKAPYVVNIQASATNGLDRDRYIDVAQVRSVSCERIVGPIGVLEDEYWQPIQVALSVILDFMA